MKTVGKYEDISRGTVDFPASYYNPREGDVNYVMKYHWHMDWELIRVNGGVLRLTLNENSFVLNGGDIFIIPGGILHGAEPEKCEYECIVMHDSVVFGAGVFAKNKIRENINHPLCFKKEKDSELWGYANTFFDALKEKKDGFEIVATGAINLLTGKIIEGKVSGIKEVGGEISSKRIDNIKGTLKVIENEYHLSLSLEKLSKTCGMSPRYFCEYFKEMTGRTPIEYLNRYRVEIACKMLTVSGMNVTEAALACGFNDISYFIRKFKKYVGKTPKQYAKNYHK